VLQPQRQLFFQDKPRPSPMCMELLAGMALSDLLCKQGPGGGAELQVCLDIMIDPILQREGPTLRKCWEDYHKKREQERKGSPHVQRKCNSDAASSQGSEECD
jgi:hypothetical protein